MKRNLHASSSFGAVLFIFAIAACSGQTETSDGGMSTGTSSSATGTGGSSATSSGTSSVASSASTGTSASATATGAGGSTGSDGAGATGSGGETTGSGGEATGSGGATTGSGGESTGSGGEATGSGRATTGSGGGPSDDYVDCPATPPTDGSACSPMTTLFCSYGDDPRWNCRIQAYCAGSIWSVGQLSEGCDTEPLPPECPEAPLPEESCSGEQLQCVYGTGAQCVCTDCPPTSPSCGLTGDPNWYCFDRPEECPLYPPNLGTRCDSPGRDCVYDCATNFTCGDNNAWTTGGSSCPICNAPDTPIATPDGDRRIAELRPGDLVYSIDGGRLAIVPIARIGSTAIVHHHVVRLELENGRVLEISPGHPTADGRSIGDLEPDDMLDGVRVISASLIPYRYGHTYDILPSSDTGTYFAGDVLIGSTLARPRFSLEGAVDKP